MKLLPSFKLEKAKIAARETLIERQRRKLFLDQTVSSIESVSSLRDIVARENPSKAPSSVIQSSLIDRSNVKINRQHVAVGKSAVRGKKPLQCTLLQCLAEAVMNVNKVVKDPKGELVSADMFRKLTEVEVAVNLKAPVGPPRNDYTYEMWWDAAIQSLSAAQMADMGKVLSEASAYTIGHCRPDHGKAFRQGVVTYWTQVVEGRKQLDVTQEKPRTLSSLVKLLKLGLTVGSVFKPPMAAFVPPLQMVENEIKERDSRPVKPRQDGTLTR